MATNSYGATPGVPSDSTPKWMFWTGWILSVLPALMLMMSGVMALSKSEQVVSGLKDFGYDGGSALFIGILALVSAILYLIPQTAVLGAILVTGYLGGATATHVRVGDPFFAPIIFGAVVWLGLYLRDARVRGLVPLRRSPSAPAPVAGGAFGVVKNVFIILAVVVVVFLGIAAVQPDEYRVSRTTTIAAPPAKVFELVNDFHKWDAWTPWLEEDPAAKVTFEGPAAGTGAIYKWSSDNPHVGEGMMTLTESRPNELVKIKLQFLRPMEGTAEAEFTFKAQGDQTVVTWTITGHKDFKSKAFCLFMNMDKMIGGEFEKGLAKMKSVAEGASKK